MRIFSSNWQGAGETFASSKRNETKLNSQHTSSRFPLDFDCNMLATQPETERKGDEAQQLWLRMGAMYEGL